MDRATGAWIGVVEELGGLLAFSIALRLVGLRTAIAVLLLFVLADGIRRLCPTPWRGWAARATWGPPRPS